VYFHTPQLDSNTPGTIHHLPSPAILEPVPGLTNSDSEICPLCQGSGLRVIQKDGRQFAEPCECQVKVRIERALTRAGVPERYRSKSLQFFETDGKHHSLYEALSTSRKFVDNYPFGIDGLGLMIVGSSGLGKTHLAIGILQALITEKRVDGLFFDYLELLKKIQNSYNPSVSATELSILQPVFEAEVLVLDDLGASKPTDWVWDTVAHILNSRYARNKSTIITTNFPNDPALGRTEANSLGSAGRAVRGETLGDRIGDRMWSRLQEMCVVVEVQGTDRRENENKAVFRGFF
jgi:DNA replication protein DnaC